MCYARPGPRCAAHLKDQLKKQEKQVSVAQDKVSGSLELLSQAQNETNAYPSSRAHDVEQAAVSKVKTAREEYEDAQREQRLVQFEYDGTPAGQKELENAQRILGYSPDAQHYAEQAKAYYDSRKVLADAVDTLMKDDVGDDGAAIFVGRMRTSTGRAVQESLIAFQRARQSLEDAELLEDVSVFGKKHARAWTQEKRTEAVSWEHDARALVTAYLSSPEGQRELALRAKRARKKALKHPEMEETARKWEAAAEAANRDVESYFAPFDSRPAKDLQPV